MRALLLSLLPLLNSCAIALGDRASAEVKVERAVAPSIEVKGDLAVEPEKKKARD